MAIEKLNLPYSFSIEEHSYGRVFNTTLAACERPLKTPYEESLLAAKALSNSIGENQSPVLILNANWESLCTFYAFLKAGIKFSVLNLTFKAEFKDEDHTWLMALCGQYNINISAAAFDFNNPDHTAELDHIASELQCNEINILLNIWAACQTDDHPVLPGYFTFPTTVPMFPGAKWNLPVPAQKKYFDFFAQTGGMPFFLGATPELAHSFLTTKIANECLSLKEINNDSIALGYEVKAILYTDAGFPEPISRPPLLREKYILAARSLRSIDVSRYLASKFIRVRAESSFAGFAHKIESFLQPPLTDVLRMQTQALIQSMTGGGLVLPKTTGSEVQCVALFPKLMTLHNFEGDLAPILKMVEARDYHSNLQNLNSKQDLHFDPAFAPLMSFFKHAVFEYFNQLGYFVEDIEICLCWANKSAQGQSHHRHRHPNSHVSGVFYLSTAGEGNVVFHNEDYQHIVPALDKETLWNANSFQVKPKAGLLLVFSSDTTHSTLVNMSTQARYSISFNAVIRGQLGSLEQAAWVNL